MRYRFNTYQLCRLLQETASVLADDELLPFLEEISRIITSYIGGTVEKATNDPSPSTIIEVDEYNDIFSETGEELPESAVTNSDGFTIFKRNLDD